MQAQMEELQHAIQESTRRLEELKQRRLRAEEELARCTRETERRVELVLQKGDVTDVLEQLGHLLQEERQLSDQASAEDQHHVDLKNDLLERNECATNKARSLSAEILEVKRCLAEAKARNTAASALIHTASSRPKRNQSKLK